MAMNVKKGDTVIVLSGKDKGKQGKVLGTVPSEAKVVVEGINKVTKHNKPSAQNQEGGIAEKEAALDISNVMLVVDGQTTRVGFKVEDGKKIRIAKKTGKEIK